MSSSANLSLTCSSATANVPFTMRSALMSTFPWLTDFLTDRDGSLGQQEAYKTLFEMLADFEGSVDTATGSTADDVKRALVLVVQGDNDMPSNVPLNRPVCRRAMELLSLYRLVDILHFLHGRKVRQGNNPHYMRLPIATPGTNARDWPTNDWTATLRNARSHILQLQAMSEDPNPDQPLPARLLGDLYRISGQYNGMKILFNFQMAAIGLYFILQGHRGSASLSLPGFPTDLGQVGSLSGLSAEQRTFLQGLMQEFELYKRRYPLSLALLVSPVCLLVSKKLLSRVIAQENLLKISKMLGNEKPAILLEVEFKLWQALLAVATGTKTAVTAVTDFLEADVPWDQLEQVSDADRDFLLADPNLPGVKGFKLLSLQNEREVHVRWPLAHLRPGYAQGTPQPGGDGDDSVGQEGPGEQDSVDSSAASPPHEEGGNEDETAHDQDSVDSSAASPPHVEGGNEDGTAHDQEQGKDEDKDVQDTGEDSSGSNPSTTKRNKAKSTIPPKADSTTKAFKQRPKRPHPPRSIKPPTSMKKTVKRQSSPSDVIGEGTFLDPIQIEAFIEERDLTLEVDEPQTRVLGSKLPLYGHLPIGTEWEPTFHFESDLRAFERIASYVEHFYIDGQPRHVASPNTSHIAVLEFPAYNAMPASELQALLRNRHILVTGCPTRPVSFNAKGLRTLANMEVPIDIQNQSIDVSDDADYSRQMSTGSLRQMLDASSSPTGPILNALSFPQPLRGIEPNNMSSEIEAWKVTVGRPFCGRNLTFPTGAMRWGLAATRGARHWIHVDSDGLGTWLDVQCGGKWWILFCPPDGQTKRVFSRIDTFLDKFDTNAEPGGRWDLKTSRQERWVAEAVYLTPGTRLIMRPNTPHAVFTTDHCISQGGHFYSTSNLQDTFYGIVHCLMGDRLITNTTHLRSRHLLMRMMQYLYKCFVTGADSDEYSAGHLPDLLDTNSMIDVLTLCNFCILSNVLDFRTYRFAGVAEEDTPGARDRDQRDRWDRNALPSVDRQYFVYIRGLAINLIKWLCHNFEALSRQSLMPIDFERDVCGDYLTSQACAILNYKRKAQAEGVATIPWCKFADIDQQVNYIFHAGNDDDDEPWYGDWTTKRENFEAYDRLSFDGPDFVLSRLRNYDPFLETSPYSTGLTDGDKKFRTGTAVGFPSAKKNEPVEEQEHEESDEDEGSDSTDEYRPLKRKRPSTR